MKEHIKRESEITIPIVPTTPKKEISVMEQLIEMAKEKGYKIIKK
jgi:hypothetical protein